MERKELGLIVYEGQVKDEDGDRPTGFDDTICPVDFPENGQIRSDQVRRDSINKFA